MKRALYPVVNFRWEARTTLDEQPVHTVVLEHSFVMMKTEVTQELFLPLENLLFQYL